MAGKGKIHIGTSGWHYMHWIGKFYPDEMKPKDFKEHYQKYFKTVEINNSFYHLPSFETFSNWRVSTPDDFVFSVKASRFITHMKKLKDPQNTFANFIQNVDGLEEKLGPILFQLPPKWQFNEERFRDFLETLPKKGYRFTFEFRNDTWYNETVYELLKKHNMAFCIYELEHHQSPQIVTSDFVYVRLHGPEKKYSGNYSNQTLEHWAEKCKTWQEDNKDVYIYFDNDQLGYAAFNALTLIEKVGNGKVEVGS
ncbi:MAG TPA: DUF72 domain-containing protein [Cytophagales bacterium]|nr:DUF72 domain-containing protein [Cytophagales bacterium]